MMRHERESNQPARQRQQELEVASGCAALRERHLEVIVAACDLDLMRGRIRIAEARSTIDFETETARGGLTITVPQVAEPPGIARAVEQLRVLQGDLASLAGAVGELWDRPHRVDPALSEQGRRDRTKNDGRSQHPRRTHGLHLVRDAMRDARPLPCCTPVVATPSESWDYATAHWLGPDSMISASASDGSTRPRLASLIVR